MERGRKTSLERRVDEIRMKIKNDAKDDSRLLEWQDESKRRKMKLEELKKKTRTWQPGDFPPKEEDRKDKEGVQGLEVPDAQVRERRSSSYTTPVKLQPSLPTFDEADEDLHNQLEQTSQMARKGIFVKFEKPPEETRNGRSASTTTPTPTTTTTPFQSTTPTTTSANVSSSSSSPPFNASTPSSTSTATTPLTTTSTPSNSTPFPTRPASNSVTRSSRSPSVPPSPVTPPTLSRSQSDLDQERAASSGVLVSWLAHCHEKGLQAYSSDLLGLVEFLSDGYHECNWSYAKMSVIAEVIKGAIERSHGFEGFQEEDLLTDVLRLVKSLETAKSDKPEAGAA